MSEKVGPMGGNNGVAFDDGVFDGVKKIIIGKNIRNVNYIKIEYEKDGKFEIREHGTNRGRLQEFSMDYPSEYIIAVGGGYDDIFGYGAALIKSLLFKTSYGRTSPILGHMTLLGNPVGKEFMLEGKNGGKLIGFHGRAGEALDAIGPHFSVVDSSLKHFKLQGGNGGFAWDDGAFDGVRKVLVGRNGKNVGYVRFEYAKGQRTIPHAHGHRQEAPQEFAVDYPNEHITSAEGTIDVYLTSLTFKTSKGRTSPAFGTVVGSKFVFQETGFKLVGIYGRSGNVIDSLGAYFAPLPAPAPSQVPKNSVTKIYISSGNGGIEQIKFDTVENGETEEGLLHGVKGTNVISAVAVRNYPDDYLVYVESWYDSSNVFQGIKFKTDKNTSEFFGYKLSEDDGTPFSLHVKDKKITGFARFANSNLNFPGTYFVLNHSALTPSTAKKLQAKGGNGGASWDDGVFDGVKKILVGQGNDGVAFVTFEYNKGTQAIIGDGHGKKTLLGTETFELDFPSEYLTSVEGYYDKIFGVEAEVVTSLTFKTNKRTSQPFGLTAGEHFELKEEGYKIVGFHGKASDVVHQIGVHVEPIFTNYRITL
ncbi:PREDICTED: myrosinase-binding protein 2-like [Camelina sativa]|uniref:Myrosinase-binding protein 2-like n=1 Tax=Camelina sativa TaxID=90675 RepID=A0ABM0VWD7_CAMSA|nr:PREDICTED: myrosinase-binding protein 2-like [Camelina sativa]XP_010462042.1 PREDICTED: myrosinase-binding protein 2-like [Camelina sativa]XP_010462043.1 PREDICTED: myrosinase-binding protein 2-like [Camelina sativa]